MVEGRGEKKAPRAHTPAPKVKLLVELRKHLVTRPAEAGAEGAWLVVVPRVHDAAVALGGPLSDVVGAVDHKHARRRLAELARNTGPDTPGADHDDVVHVRVVAAGRAGGWVAWTCLASRRWRGVAQLRTVLDRQPLTAAIHALFAVYGRRVLVAVPLVRLLLRMCRLHARVGRFF